MKKILIIGMLLGILLVGCVSKEAESTSTISQPIPVETPTVEALEPVEEVVAEIEVEVEEVVEEEEPVVTHVRLGTFTLTAYCSCERCCGYWATIRPLDENGKPIVYTASGTVAQAGRTIAVDTSVISYGSNVEINGHVYTAEDTGSGINGNRIDVYFDDHDEALVFGVQTEEVFLLIGDD